MKNSIRRDLNADNRKTEVACWKFESRKKVKHVRGGAFPFTIASVNVSHAKYFISFCIGEQVKIKSTQR